MTNSLRCYFNWLAFDGLPEFPEGRLRAIRDAGYDGVQFIQPLSRALVDEARGLGLGVCGSGRVNAPQEAGALAAEAREAGLECLTIHLGWGIEDDDFRGEGFRGQAGLFPRALEVSEVDVSRQILLARAGQEAGTRAMATIGSQGALGPLWREELFGLKAVIDGQKCSFGKSPRSLRPPASGFRAKLNRETVGQHGDQFGGKFQTSLPQFKAEKAGFTRPSLPGKTLAGGRWDRWGGRSCLAFKSDSPLKPSPGSGVPAETVDGHGVQQFVGKDNATDSPHWGNRFRAPGFAFRVQHGARDWQLGTGRGGG